MKKVICILAFSILCLKAQVLKVTPEGFLLVQDSITNTPLSSEIFSNFKGPFYYDIIRDKYWMEKNTGKYFNPTIEENQYIVLKQKSGWGAVTLQGKTFIPFQEVDQIYFFRKATCYGAKVKEGSGIYKKLNSNSKYLGNFAIIDLNGNVIGAYEFIADESKGSCLVFDRASQKYGIINNQVDTVAEFKYTCTSWDDKNFGFSDRGFIALKNPEKKCGIMSYKGKTVMPFAYDYIDDLVFPTARINQGEKWGVLNNKDLMIKVPIKYEDIQCSANGGVGDFFTAVAKDSSGYDVYDSSFSRMGHYHFEELGYSMNDPLAVLVKENGKYGLYDFTKNRYTFSPRFDQIDSECLNDCDHPYYVLYNGDSIMVTNNKGKIQQQYIGSGIESLWFEYSKLKMKDGTSRVLKNLQVYLPDTFQTIKMIVAQGNNGKRLFIAQKNNQYAVLNEKGEIVLPYQYDKIEGWTSLGNNDYIMAHLNGKIYLYNASLDRLNVDGFDELPITFISPGNVDPSSSVVAMVGKKYGAYDLDKRTFIVPAVHDTFDLLYLDPTNWFTSEIWAIFQSDGRVQAYNMKLEKVFEGVGEKVFTSGANDKLVLQKNKLCYLIKMDGTPISKGYESMEYMIHTNGLLGVKSKGKYGCMDQSGKIVIPIQYNEYCNNDYMFTTRGWAFSFKQKNTIYRYNSAGEVMEEGELMDPFCY